MNKSCLNIRSVSRIYEHTSGDSPNAFLCFGSCFAGPTLESTMIYILNMQT